MQFINTVNLDEFYIEIGPEKWVTIPSGYVKLLYILFYFFLLK